MLSIVPFGKQIRLIMHSNVKFPMRLYKQIVCLNGITGKLFGIFWGHYMVFSYVPTKCIDFLLLLTFLSFSDKNLWFSSQRRREGVIGDANGSISKIMYCTCFLSSSQK